METKVEGSSNPLGQVDRTTLPNGNGNGNGNGKRPADADPASSDLSEEDLPLIKRTKGANGAVNGATKTAVAPADESSDEDMPLAAKADVSNRNGQASSSKRARPAVKAEESDDDVPLARTPSGSSRPSRARGSKSMREPSATESDSDSDVPLTAKDGSARKSAKKPTPKKPPTPRRTRQETEESSDEDLPLAKQTKRKRAPAKKRSLSADDGEPTPSIADSNDEDAGQENPEGDGTKKWDTLEHNGPMFPDPYTPLPDGVKLKYDGKPVPLPPTSEEIATFYAAKIKTQHALNPTFNKNFFRDFQDILKKHPPLDGTKIKSFEKCNFEDIYNYLEGEKDAVKKKRASMSSKERADISKARTVYEKKWSVAYLDGNDQKVGNFRVEPPGLFMGRGAHPKTGMVKKRIRPEDITINISKGVKVPEPPQGHKWKQVVHKNDVTWLAFWRENVNGNFKYVFLHATSNLKAQADREKYEKARRLDNCVEAIRRDMRRDLTNGDMEKRQLATVIYLIDNFSLRAGNEKDEDEAETFGACSLLIEHATLREGNVVSLHFLGKDSMVFQQDLPVSPQVYKNFKIFRKSKTGLKGPKDEIFDWVNTTKLNKHLGKYMKGLSAKVFRTYNASATFQALLNNTEQWLASQPDPSRREPTKANLKLAYNHANMEVAILCNHQKTVDPLKHQETMVRMDDRIRAIKYQRMKLRQELFAGSKMAELKALDPSIVHPKLTKRELTDEILKEESDLEDEWIEKYEREELWEKKKEKLEKDVEQRRLTAEYEAANPGVKKEEKKKGKGEEDEKEKKKQERKRPLTPEEVAAKRKELDATYAHLRKEAQKGKWLPRDKDAEQKGPRAPAVLIRQLRARKESILKMLAEKDGRESLKEVALGTSKLNYLDPRITFAWVAKWAQVLDAQDLNGRAESTKKPKTTKKEGGEEEEKTPLQKQYDGLLSVCFPKTLQEKFVWAKVIDAKWQFVTEAEKKMKTLGSAVQNSA